MYKLKAIVNNNRQINKIYRGTILSIAGQNTTVKSPFSTNEMNGG